MVKEASLNIMNLADPQTDGGMRLKCFFDYLFNIYLFHFQTPRPEMHKVSKPANLIFESGLFQIEKNSN